jgi:hypothetical protein
LVSNLSPLRLILPDPPALDYVGDMSIGDRIRDALPGDKNPEPDGGPAEGPAAASRPANPDRRAATNDQSDVSAGGSGASVSETSGGGADAVPDTPDGVAEDYT